MIHKVQRAIPKSCGNLGVYQVVPNKHKWTLWIPMDQLYSVEFPLRSPQKPTSFFAADPLVITAIESFIDDVPISSSTFCGVFPKFSHTFPRICPIEASIYRHFCRGFPSHVPPITVVVRIRAPRQLSAAVSLVAAGWLMEAENGGCWDDYKY